MNTQSGKPMLFFFSALIISGLIAYFGYRTIAHEGLLRHYQANERAHNAIRIIEAKINERLSKQAEYFSQLIPGGSQNLLTSDFKDITRQASELDMLFVFTTGRLIYPEITAETDQDELKWVNEMMPVVNDPVLLYSHSVTTDHNIPQSGWFARRVDEVTQLIYWVRKEQYWIGFQYPYAVFLAEVINLFEPIPEARYTIREDDRILVMSGAPQNADQSSAWIYKQLPYPLHTWQIEYALHLESLTPLYFGGSLIILMIIFFVSGFFYYMYREYQRTIKQALQQVSFVGQVSHELKTPLTNILLYTDLLKEDLDDHTEYMRGSLEVIANEGQRLSRLIQNVLSFSRIPECHFTLIELNQLAEKIQQIFAPSFVANKMILHLKRSTPCWVNSDEDQLTQIIGNFLNNAEKYAREGVQVDLEVVPLVVENSVAIQVRDYGKGVTENQLKQLFVPFYRVHRNLSEGVSGTGIGLTISSQLAINLGVKIIAENMDKGMRFTLILPMAIRET